MSTHVESLRKHAAEHRGAPVADCEWCPQIPDAEDVVLALAAADAGSAGHWPTVAAVLAAEVRRQRQPLSDDALIEEAGSRGLSVMDTQEAARLRALDEGRDGDA